MYWNERSSSSTLSFKNGVEQESWRNTRYVHVVVTHYQKNMKHQPYAVRPPGDMMYIKSPPLLKFGLSCLYSSLQDPLSEHFAPSALILPCIPQNLPCWPSDQTSTKKAFVDRSDTRNCFRFRSWHTNPQIT